MSEDKLAAFLKTVSDWGRLKTSIPGVFVLKMPAYKSIPARLAVELNPADSMGQDEVLLARSGFGRSDSELVKEILSRKITGADRAMELFSTHPNVVKRLRALAKAA